MSLKKTRSSCDLKIKGQNEKLENLGIFRLVATQRVSCFWLYIEFDFDTVDCLIISDYNYMSFDVK